MMKTFTLRSQFHFTRHINLTTPTPTPTPKTLHFLPISYSKYPTKSSPYPKKSTTYQPLILKPSPNAQKPPNQEFHLVSSNGLPRVLVLGAVSLGFAMFVAGLEDHKALALDPEGPLMEEFWDNMRRYGLYVLTVSTGVIYTISQPILELLKNPITAILIIVVLGGSFYIVSQVLSAMVGVSEFAYEYGY
ncbi:hypothetical protein GIB67_013407 [Kingdonia uniflora]|uniref:Uncharacterized protein ycf33 n=1 Tax=Kingdonia uniflora TaxID=39325 RepID=A0A7J7LQX8_9MAGN|nr:hypothetical protein GIB67_013407 [Kingdonia uniflora]